MIKKEETIQKIYAERQELFAKNEENIKMIQSLEDAARKMKNEITVLSNEVGTQWFIMAIHVQLSKS